LGKSQSGLFHFYCLLMLLDHAAHYVAVLNRGQMVLIPKGIFPGNNAV
jgi:hypothetical protein